MRGQREEEVGGVRAKAGRLAGRDNGAKDVSGRQAAGFLFVEIIANFRVELYFLTQF
jgi:hypothetical protein